MGRKVYITRGISICAAHRLHAAHLSDEENAQIYGKCNHIHGHGHNYRIEATLFGEVDKNGMVMNLTELKSIMEEVILKPMDHKFLDKDVEYFKTHPSTAENISIFIWNQINPKLKPGLLYEVRVIETDNNTAFYRGEDN